MGGFMAGFMDSFVALYIFILAAVTAYEIVSKVPATLHTSLLSAANFIHGIVLIGAMIVMGRTETTIEITIGFIAVALAAANVIGGYVVTSRMLSLFNKNKNNNAIGDK